MASYTNLNPAFLWALDIETAGNANAEAFIARFPQSKVASNIKDPEKIKAHREANLIKDLNQAALCWMSGKVVSWSLTSVGDVATGKKKLTSHAMCGFDEKVLLQGLMDAIQENDVVNMVGKNSDTFDVPFIKGRCIATGVGMSDVFHSGYNFFDIDKMICPSMAGQKQHGKLDAYAFACGLDGKTAEGSYVPKAYIEAVAAQIAGDSAKVREIMVGIKKYNIADTELTARLAYGFIKPWEKNGGINAKK